MEAKEEGIISRPKTDLDFFWTTSDNLKILDNTPSRKISIGKPWVEPIFEIFSFERKKNMWAYLRLFKSFMKFLI